MAKAPRMDAGPIRAAFRPKGTRISPKSFRIWTSCGRLRSGNSATVSPVTLMFAECGHARTVSIDGVSRAGNGDGGWLDNTRRCGLQCFQQEAMRAHRV